MDGLPPDGGRGSSRSPDCADPDCSDPDCADPSAELAPDCATKGAAASSSAAAGLPIDTSGIAMAAWPPQWTYCPPCDIRLAGREDARNASGGAAEEESQQQRRQGDGLGARAPVAVSEPALGSWGGALAGVLKGGGSRLSGRNGPLGPVLGHMACAVFGCTCER